MENIIPVVILVLLVGGAVLYIWRSKKRGAKCIGCPHARNCKSGPCSCHGEDESES